MIFGFFLDFFCFFKYYNIYIYMGSANLDPKLLVQSDKYWVDLEPT